VVTFNAVAAVSGAAASLLPGGDPQSLDADTADSVLEKMSQVMTDARGHLAEKLNDIPTALTHNQTALAALRQDEAAAVPLRSHRHGRPFSMPARERSAPIFTPGKSPGPAGAQIDCRHAQPC
jgi:hypothetical protein